MTAQGSGAGLREVRVVRAQWECEDVVSLELSSVDGDPLEVWTPGSHVDVLLPSGLLRQYSLCGRPDAGRYTIAVARDRNSRGGSLEIHDTALLGKTLRIRGPVNRFPLDPATSYLFVAGGIGITPLLPMIREVALSGADWKLYYGGRSATSLPFTSELGALADQSNGSVELVYQDLAGPLPIVDIVHSAPSDSIVYACGPGGMLSALEQAMDAQRPGLRLVTERFNLDSGSPAAPSDDQLADSGTQAPFTVTLARSDQTVTVQAGQTILDAIRSVRPDTLYSCEEGFCGTCETKVLEGRPIHRDTILSASEREKGETMMICVGGCEGSHLVLDL